MSSSNLTPGDLDSLLGVVNESNTLAEVELDILARVDSLNLEERLVLVLRVISSANQKQ